MTYKVRYYLSPQRRISPRRSSNDGKGTGGSLFCTARACDVIARLYFCTYTPGHRRTWRDTYLPCNGHAFVNTAARRARSGRFINQIEAIWMVQPSVTFLRINKTEVGVNFLNKNLEALIVHSFNSLSIGVFTS